MTIKYLFYIYIINILINNTHTHTHKKKKKKKGITIQYSLFFQIILYYYKTYILSVYIYL